MCTRFDRVFEQQLQQKHQMQIYLNESVKCAISFFFYGLVWVKYLMKWPSNGLFGKERNGYRKRWQPSMMNNRSPCHIMKCKRRAQKRQLKWCSIIFLYSYGKCRIRRMGFPWFRSNFQIWSNDILMRVFMWHNKRGDDIDDIDLKYSSRQNKIDWILWVRQLVWQLTVEHCKKWALALLRNRIQMHTHIYILKWVS